MGTRKIGLLDALAKLDDDDLKTAVEESRRRRRTGNLDSIQFLVEDDEGEGGEGEGKGRKRGGFFGDD